VVESGINKCHGINFSGISTLDRTSRYLARLVQEITEICLNKNDFNGNSSFIRNQAWSPITSMLMNEKQDQAEQVLDSAY
jgi:hypothetical protein